MCDHSNREAAMVTVRRDANGKPTVWCDPCLEPLVSALNDGGLDTVASCCGHGKQPGNVALRDGRELLILPDFDTARRLEAAEAESATLRSRLDEVRALHTRRECDIYDDEECADRTCEHPPGTCVVLTPAVCGHCADQTEPGGDWEHLIRPDAYWPCATICAVLRAAADETPGDPETG